MAIPLLSGSFQRTLSTPGVFLPWFSVTRRTAKALPLNEWVRRCCKAFTLFHFLACAAFTIRIWSRRTLRWTLGQSMACQSLSTWETAPTSVSVETLFDVVIYSASLISSSNALVMKDLVEVGPLSRGVMLQPLSHPLQAGVRFFHIPVSAPLSAFLAVGF